MDIKTQIEHKRKQSRNDLDREMNRALRTIEIAATYSMQMFRNKARSTIKVFLRDLHSNNPQFQYRAQFSFKRNLFEINLIDGDSEYQCAPNGYHAVKSKSDEWRLDNDFLALLESCCQLLRDLIQDVEEANLEYKQVMDLVQ